MIILDSNKILMKNRLRNQRRINPLKKLLFAQQTKLLLILFLIKIINKLMRFNKKTTIIMKNWKYVNPKSLIYALNMDQFYKVLLNLLAKM